MRKLTLLVFCFLLCIYSAKAQTAASYTFTNTSGTYSSISAATGTVAASSIIVDDGNQTSIPIGFTFMFCGTPCTTLSASSNGWLSLSNANPGAAVNRTNTAANAGSLAPGLLMPFWDDLWGTSGTSTAYYQTSGTAPNRVFTFEWKNWQEYGDFFVFIFTLTAGQNNGNIQVKLYETTNVIEFCYGNTSSAFGTPPILYSVYTSGTIGIANSSTDYKTVNAPTTTSTASSSTFTTSIGTTPPANRIYRWTPNCSITGSASNSGPVCSGSALNLTGTILTGTATTFSWSGPAGYSSTQQSPTISNATVSRSGTYSFTATAAGGCSVIYTTTATVDTTPTASISGTAAFCSGGSSTITFTGTAGATVSYTINGGSPSSVVLNAAGTASVSTGVLTTGATATTYTYALTGATLGSCSRSLSSNVVVTVNPLPAPITGSSALCVSGFSTTLTSSPGTGTWSSSASGIASVNATTGVVTPGSTAGSANIIYTLPVTGCSASLTVNVSAAPPPIAGTLQVCQSGGTTTLTNAMTPGTWSLTPATYATINATTGMVTGILPGVVTVTYQSSAGCTTTTTVTVNPSLSAITGPSAVCENASVTLANPTGGGSWYALPGTGTATIDPVSGMVTGVTAGNVTISYQAPTNCSITRTETVNAIPAPITGTTDICLGSSTTLYDLTTPGSWSSANSSIVSVNATTGVINGAGTGSTVIVYTNTSTGCYNTTPVNVNPLPQPITGSTFTVCAGNATITLADATPLGSWTSGATSTADVNIATGVVTGLTAGTAPITFTIDATGCYTTANVTVIPTPANISGPAEVCEAGSTISLTDATTPGTWSISPTGAASISMAGVVTGNTAGTATVTYTRTNSCFVTYPIVVNPLPAALTGTMSVCQAAVTTLSSAPGGGSWATGDGSIATVGSSGDVHGVLGGNVNITYTLPTGCRASASVTVNAIPGPVTGQNFVCLGSSTSMSNSVSGGTWSATPSSIVTVDAMGNVYGVSLGSGTVQYTTGTNGCFTTKSISVNPMVTPSMNIGVSPTTEVCAGTSVSFTAGPVNGGTSPIIVWSVNGVILSGASSYTYTPADNDQVRCWFISSYQCAAPDTASAVVNLIVHPNVTPSLSLSIMGGDTVCTGALTTINANPTNGGTAPTYQWVVNLSPVSSGPSLTYTPSNGDVVTCNMTSNAWCQSTSAASATKIITVSPFLEPMAFINSSLGLAVCDGYPDVFTASQVNGGTSPAYQWLVNNNPVGTGPVYSYAPVNGDQVSVVMTSNFPCLTRPADTETMSMTVLPITQPVGVVTAQPGYIVPEGVNDTFTCTILSGGGIAPQYQWFVNNYPQPGATNSVFITNALHTGDSVNCQVTNTDQCSGVSVFNFITITIGNNVGVNQVSALNYELHLAPNPNSGSFILEGSLADNTDENLQLEITDMLGRVVYHGKAQARNGKISHAVSLSDATSGNYLLTVRSATVNTTLRFVIP